jgi:hypothetical protein
MEHSYFVPFTRHQQCDCMRLRSSGMLRSVDLWFVTDVSGQPIPPIFKGQAVQVLDCLTFDRETLTLKNTTRPEIIITMTMNYRNQNRQKQRNIANRKKTKIDNKK